MYGVAHYPGFVGLCLSRQATCTGPYLPPPAPLAFVLVGQHRTRARLAADGDVPARVQLVCRHALARMQENL